MLSLIYSLNNQCHKLFIIINFTAEQLSTNLKTQGTCNALKNLRLSTSKTTGGKILIHNTFLCLHTIFKRNKKTEKTLSYSIIHNGG